MAVTAPLYHAAGRGGAGAEEGAAAAAPGRDGLAAAGGAERGCGVAVGAGLWGSAVASKAAKSLRCTLGLVAGGEGGGALLVGVVHGCVEPAGGAAAPGGGVGMAVVWCLVARVLRVGVREGRREAAGAVAGASGSMERVMRLKVGVRASSSTRPLRGLVSVGE